MNTGKIALSGAHGFIGSKLCQALKQAGFKVCPMVRKKTNSANEIFYDYHNREIDREKLASCDAVIHLAGKNILSGFWTKKRKMELYDSRVKSTRFIAHVLSELEQGPKVLLSASAVGIYGDQRDLKLDEATKPGLGFLAHLCVDWERGTLFAKSAGLRVVNMRFGTVLDRDGGMLRFLSPIVRLGLGGLFGSGEQYFSFVTRDELIEQIIFALKNESIIGPVNMVAHEPTTNKQFIKALATILHRKAFFHIPAIALKVLGDQGKMLLASQRVYPRILLDEGFLFEGSQNIEEVLARVLRR